MNFRRSMTKDVYLQDTSIENIFINEYMPQAPGDYVKVYLFALMYADYHMSMTNETMAKQLCMEDEDVLKAWTYWEKMGVIKKHYEKKEDKFHYKVEFINLKELMYGKTTKAQKEEEQIPERLKSLMNDDTLKDMYHEIERITGRLFDGKEPTEILSWLTDYNATPEMIVYAYSYCTRKRNQNGHKYVGTVVKEWAAQGYKTIEKIESHLEENDNRHYLYKRVLKALGFLRNPTEEEKRIMDTWFDEMAFPIDRVLDACKKTTGISNPNINYINTVLKAWNNGTEKDAKGKNGSSGNGADGKTVSIASIMKEYDEIRARNESLAEERRMEVYRKIPRVKEIEDEARGVGLDISRVMLSGAPDAKSRINALKSKVDHLNGEKAFLMTENNFKIDYMDMVYDCTLCKDTGTQDTGERCSCFARKLEEGKKTD